MIEMMVALGIIVLLGSIFLIAFRNVGTSGQVKQTRTVLERLRSAVGEATREKAGYAQFYEKQIPAIYTGAAPITVSATGDVEVKPDGVVHAGERTLRILYVLQSRPAVKAIFSEIPSNQLHGETVDIDPSPAVRNVQVQVPLDAWGNDILFVFDNYLAGAPNPTRVQTNGGLSGMTNEGAAFPVGGGALRAPDQLPFWVSAGPDGKFETHDDNVYSFDN